MTPPLSEQVKNLEAELHNERLRSERLSITLADTRAERDLHVASARAANTRYQNLRTTMDAMSQRVRDLEQEKERKWDPTAMRLERDREVEAANALRREVQDLKTTIDGLQAANQKPPVYPVTVEEMVEIVQKFSQARPTMTALHCMIPDHALEEYQPNRVSQKMIETVRFPIVTLHRRTRHWDSTARGVQLGQFLVIP